MTVSTRLVLKIYRLMLVCYPAEFRAKFSTEMQEVFSMAVNEVQNANQGGIWRLLWRELQSWPGSVLKEHLQERINKMGSQIALENPKPLSGLDWLAALIIFILPLVGTAFHKIAIVFPDWISIFLLVFFLSSIAFAFILAVVRGLPRWSLSYVGLILTIMVFYSLGIVLWGLFFYPAWMLIFGPMNSWSLPVRLLYSGLMNAFTWFLVLSIALILVALLRHWSKVQSLWQHIRDDWTHLSFLVYGGLVFYIWLTFDEYQNEDPWIFAAFTGLAIGAWLHLVAKSKTTRILALVGGVTAAMWVVALGKWNLVPLQSWPVNLESERLYETLAAISSWIVMIMTLLAPVLLNLLPTSRSPMVDNGITPA